MRSGRRKEGAVQKKQIIFRHKEECLKDFVSIPQYIRNFTSLENSISKLVESVSEMKGSLRVIEQMPQICSVIAREIVKEMK